MDIVRETKSWIAVHKPAGIAVQTKRIGQTDLESELLKMLKNRQGDRLTEKPEDDAAVPYLAIIHRLDQPVEGIVLFAKNTAAAASLSRQMQEQQMTKEYLACVHWNGSHPDPEAADKWHVLEDYLVKDGRTNISKTAAAGTPGARKAKLEYRIMETSDDTAILSVRLHTGRHHQIRVQLAHAGFPVVGDRKYGREEGKNIRKRTDKEDQAPALCAYRLVFRDPDSGRTTELKVTPFHRRLCSDSGHLSGGGI